MQSYRQSLVNNLGTKVEQLQTKGHRAPTKLHRRAAFLDRMTSIVKVALMPLIPTEVTDMLMVINTTPTHLTLSVTDAATANHLRYMQDSCLTYLKQADPAFSKLQHLKVVSTPDLKASHRATLAAMTHHRQTNLSNFHHFNVERFSENTVQTITQAIENVTPDSELVLALKKLFNQE